VRLNYAYQSGRRLYYDTGRVGNSNQDRTQALVENSFRWETESDNGELTYTNGAMSVAIRSGDEDLINELSDMTEFADRRIQATKNVVKSYSVELPAMLFDVQVGNQYKDNYNLSGTNIVGVKHSALTQGGKTTLYTSSI